MRRPKKTTLPKFCECGGRMVYTHDFGMVFAYCKKCTPVVKINVKKLKADLQKKGLA